MKLGKSAITLGAASRALGLRKQGLRYADIAEVLNRERLAPLTHVRFPPH